MKEEIKSEREKKEKPELSSIEDWLEKKQACTGAREWVMKNKSTLQKIKSNVKGTYNLEGSVYALGQFLSGGYVLPQPYCNEQLQWAFWYLIEILDDDEDAMCMKFAMSLLPSNYNEDKNDPVYQYVDEAVKSMDIALKEKDISMIKNVIVCVMNANKIAYPEQDGYDVFRKVIKYGIGLLKKRKK